MSVTDDIKSRIDIVNYVRRHAPALKKAGRNYKACCPFHNEKTPSFVVNPERQTWYCFGACADGGDIFSFAQKLHNWDFKEALRELAHEAGVELRPQTPEQKSQSDRLERLRGILNSAAVFFNEGLQGPDAKSVLDYIREGRGLQDATIRAFQLGYAPDSWDFMLNALRRLGHSEDEIFDAGLAARSDSGRVYDRFRNRLMIPIRDERGRVVGFGGRALNPDDNAKYINSPQSDLFDKSSLLFGLDTGKSAIRETGTAVIVEGYMDVIQAHQAGFLNVVAQMGTAMTEGQIRLVAPRFARKIVLALDADEAGQNATRRSLEVARHTLSSDFVGKLSVDIRILQIPSGKDPDDYLREQPEHWEALVDEAQAVADFVIDMETQSLTDSSSLQERQAVALQVLPILLVSEHNLYQQENIQKLARRLRISERELLAWAQEQLPPPQSTRRSAPQELAPPDLPPEYWDNDHQPAPPDAEEAETRERPSSPGRPVPGKRAIESFCLSMLLKHPNFLYQVNRKLRELAGDDEGLLQGPLRDLCASDFSQSPYRALMAYLQESMKQHDLEPLEYLGSVIDNELQAEFKALLIDEPESVAHSIRGNFSVDLSDIYRRRNNRGAPGFSARDELVCRALQLRLERLENERVELQYLQEDAQSAVDDDGARILELSEKIVLSMRAKARIDLAVSQQALPLQQV